MKINKKKFIYLISPNKISKSFYDDLDKVLKLNKVSFFQLRLKKYSFNQKFIIGKKIKKICKKYKVKFLINDDVILTKKLDADGCHLGQKDMAITIAKKLLGKKIIGIDISDDLEPIEIGKAQLIEEGRDLIILSYGTIFKECVGAVEALNKEKIFPTFIDARFAKPLDTEIISKYIQTHKLILTVEEGVIGGFSAQVNAYLQSSKYYYINNIKCKNITLPDRFIDQDTQANQIGFSGLDSEMIYKAAKELINVG